MNNFLIKLIEYRTKPDLSKYTLQELTQIFINLTHEKNEYLDEIKNIYPLNTIKIIENILNSVIKIEPDDITNKMLINWLEDFWNKLPLLNNNNDMIECGICLNYITKNDCIIFKCNHLTHTTCFLNYLYANLKINKIELEKFFRCPNCRTFLTENVQKSFEHYELLELNEQLYYNNDVDVEYGDEYNNFILQEYNLRMNTLDDHTLDNIFRISNNYDLNSNINIDISNLDSSSDTSSVSSSDSSSDTSSYTI